MPFRAFFILHFISLSVKKAHLFRGLFFYQKPFNFIFGSVPVIVFRCVIGYGLNRLRAVYFQRILCVVFDKKIQGFGSLSRHSSIGYLVIFLMFFGLIFTWFPAIDKGPAVDRINTDLLVHLTLFYRPQEAYFASQNRYCGWFGILAYK